jgi:hypothetical protein
MTNKNSVCVYTADKEYKALIVKALLEEEGISAIILSQKDSAYLFGEVSVYVSDDMLEKALVIVKNVSEL